MKLAVGLTFPNTLQNESVICYICKTFDINMNIIEASFSTSSGWAFLELEGNKEEVENVCAYIESKGIKMQRIGTKE